MLNRWFERVPIADLLQRRHAVTLQWFVLVFTCGVAVIEAGRFSSGAMLQAPASSAANGLMVLVMLGGVA
ncbi:hypothetical protein, partial [Klebsiella pneumoniae]|uniref:hypothetical protein n=1 Tax=Klebsiella pneumoniae TaxID=573 RepID=UPI00385300BE